MILTHTTVNKPRINGSKYPQVSKRTATSVSTCVLVHAARCPLPAARCSYIRHTYIPHAPHIPHRLEEPAADQSLPILRTRSGSPINNSDITLLDALWMATYDWLLYYRYVRALQPFACESEYFGGARVSRCRAQNTTSTGSVTVQFILSLACFFRFPSPPFQISSLSGPGLRFHALVGADSAARRPGSHKRCFEGAPQGWASYKSHPFGQSMKMFDVLPARHLAQAVSQILLR
jgi:hypothetical protein